MPTLMRFLFRLVLVLAATVFMASLALAGVMLALGYALWCLVRGRRPQWPTIFMGPLRHMRRHGGGFGGGGFGGGGFSGNRTGPSGPSGPMPGWRRSGHGADAGVIEGNAREL
ncbi:hypothetical protein [Leptothrix discophora]|uniref:Uncharacterized protein n=1 Tax=Leptothrix discophora TaxID=89 RepID=A0ABT9G2Y4_LEPDI|nr:hypothetical protein [Leptothrix discophora]MDP4300845.1 hypothetical protein [Leptothrix discophora]